jgi:uncharacterized protein (TIGR03435 family)
MGQLKRQIVLLSLACTLHLPAQQPTPLAFDIASIKTVSGKMAPTMKMSAFGVECVCSVRSLIALAYSVQGRSISGSNLLDSALYEVVAKTDHEVSHEQLAQMLQTLLADRFKLAVRHDSKVEPVYTLTVAASGSKLKDSSADGTSGCEMGANRTTKCSKTTMSSLSTYLTSRMGRVVLDHTGLTGSYDFTLQLEGIPSLDELRSAISSGGDPAAAKRSIGTAMNDWTTSSIFSDIQKQLGLKLDADKAPVDNLVVERLEKPSEN